MFDLVRNNQKVVQLVLALIMLPFALWGVDSYRRNAGNASDVAQVGGTSIGQDEFQRALHEQQERLRAQNVPAPLLEGPEIRRGVLEDLINRRLLLLHASKSNTGVSDAMLFNFISALPSLQVDGKFSRERYEALAAAQGMSLDQFEALLRRDFVMQQVMLPAGGAAVTGHLSADRWLVAQLEEREIAEATLRAEQFPVDAKPDAEAVKRYYDEHRTRFEQPEQVRVEFVALNQDKLTENIKIGDEEARKWYQANEARFKKPEERRASHILILADKKMSEAEQKAAEEKANKLLAQLQGNTDFAKLAKENSQDPGSAAKGGDLGFFGRGMMVKPFEDAAFALQENQLSGVVRTDFGFHIIKLTGIHPERAQAFDEVRNQIVTELKRQAGAKQYAEMAEAFTNTVYEQPDSLKPAAEKFGLTLQTSDWMSRTGQLLPPFTQPKLLQAVFSEDAIKNRRNTEAIEVAAKTLVAAHVVEHRPAAVEPLDAVAGVIEKALRREASVAKAVAAGTAELDKLKKGEKGDVKWGTARTISRLHAPDLSPEGSAAIFAADVKTLPAYAGIKEVAGYALYRIDKVKPFDPAAEGDAAPRAKALRQKYGDLIAQEDTLGWLAALREQYGVTINRAALERK